MTIQTERALYRHADLQRALSPRSIAIVGVSTNPGSFGARTVERLGRYPGKLFLINPKYERIGEQRCYPSVQALPEVPDLVIVAAARDMVLGVAQECASLGVGGLLIYAAGFAETGDADGAALQRQLSELPRTSGMRIVGPNSLGFSNFVARANATFWSSTFLETPAPHAIGLVSQSGAFANALCQAIERGVQISHSLSCGNSCDVDIADMVAYLAEDAGCRAIACLFEGISSPQRLLEAAEIAWNADKPLIVCKIARGESGAEAALSHTGSLAGSHAAYKAALTRFGVIMVDDPEALIETAAFFAKAPRAGAAGVAAIATSGGAAVVCADMAEDHGVPLPQPSDPVRQVLEAHIPDFGSARNPCDVTAQVLNDPASLRACVEALYGDPQYGAMVLANPYTYAGTLQRTSVLGEYAKKAGKVACYVSFSEWLEGPGLREAELNPDVTVFRSFSRCFRTLASWQWRVQARARGPRQTERRVNNDAVSKAAALLAAAPNDTLTEREAKDVLNLYGVPVVQEVLAQSGAEAVAAACELGLPVVLKVESPDLPHKTEAGVIRLNLRTGTAVSEAYEQVMANARKVQPPPRIQGVLVQPMVGAGVEVMIGARVDPVFGPLIVVGLGGIFVELLKDSALAQAPVTASEAASMLRSLKGFALLDGFRGSDRVDLSRLVDVICRVSEFAWDHQDRISELDVNPLICSGERITAVDALIFRRAS